MAVLVGTLIAGQGRVEASLVDAILGALAAVARDDEGRVAIQEAGGIPLIIKLMDGGPDMVRHELATGAVYYLEWTAPQAMAAWTVVFFGRLSPRNAMLSSSVCARQRPTRTCGSPGRHHGHTPNSGTSMWFQALSWLLHPQLSTRAATELVGQLSHTEEIKGAIRDNGGILALMRCVCMQSSRPSGCCAGTTVSHESTGGPSHVCCC